MRGSRYRLESREGRSPWDVKVREVIALLEQHGWRLVRQRGSHRQFRHQSRSGLVTVAGNRNVDLAVGTLRSIFKQAGLYQ